MKNKIINGIIIMIFIAITSSITVYATSTYLINSSDVYYDNTKSGLTSTDVQSAIDELASDANDYSTLKQAVINMSYPVGSIFMSVDLSTVAQVQNKFGGTWERYGTGKVLKSTSTSSGLTGGSATVTLAEANIPEHTHTISHTHGTPATNTTSGGGAHTHSTTATTTSKMSLTANKNANAINHTHSLKYKISSNEAKGYAAANSGAFGNRLMVNSGTISTSNTDGAHTHNVTGTYTVPALSVASSGAHTHTVPAMTSGAPSNANSGATGSGTGLSVEDPYITVYMYRRTN